MTVPEQQANVLNEMTWDVKQRQPILLDVWQGLLCRDQLILLVNLSWLMAVWNFSNLFLIKLLTFSNFSFKIQTSTGKR